MSHSWLRFVEMNRSLDHLDEVFYNVSKLESFEAETLFDSNEYEDPYKSKLTKAFASALYVAQLWIASIIVSFTQKEIQEERKTVINLFLLMAYMLVSFEITLCHSQMPFDMVPKLEILQFMSNFQVVLYMTVCVGLDLFGAWIGPLPWSICYFTNILKGFCAMGNCCMLLSICTFRFLFVCIWKKMRVMQDFLIFHLVWWPVWVLCLYMQVIKHSLLEKLPLNIVSFAP